MKKVTILSLFIAFLLVGVSANAQEQGEIRAGAGLALGTKSAVDKETGDEKAGLGININAEYMITDALSIAPSYTFYFKTEFDDGSKVGLNSLNIDARYYFVTGDTQFYGLAGYASLKATAEGGGFKVSATDNGFNLGAGLNLPLGDTMLGNVQAKYQKGEGDGQIVINAGVAFIF